MPRRTPTITVGGIVAGLGHENAADDGGDETAEAILDATAALLAAHGLSRWSVDDVAERSGVGRTTVYRWFGDRDVLVHATLARECRRFFASIAAAVGHLPRLEDQVAEGFLVGLRSVRGSLLDRLREVDPAAVLPLLTTDAGPLIAVARAWLVDQDRARGNRRRPGDADVVAEALVRLAVSFVLTPDSVIPLDDEARARAALRRLFRPLLASGPAR